MKNTPTPYKKLSHFSDMLQTIRDEQIRDVLYTPTTNTQLKNDFKKKRSINSITIKDKSKPNE
jgi:hypothetical protein